MPVRARQGGHARADHADGRGAAAAAAAATAGSSDAEAPAGVLEVKSAVIGCEGCTRPELDGEEEEQDVGSPVRSWSSSVSTPSTHSVSPKFVSYVGKGMRRSLRELHLSGDEKEEEDEEGAVALSHSLMLLRVMDGCKRKYKNDRRKRVSYSHPLFKELLDAFNGLSSTENTGEIGRKDIWRMIALRTVSELNLPDNYFENIDVSDDCVAEDARVQIEKDILRSGALWEENEVWIGRLRHVLRAYAAHDVVNGYTQGMNLFAAEFLYITESEEMAFLLILYVCQTSRIAPDYYTKDMVGLKRDIWVMQQLLERNFSGLMDHFKRCSLDVTYVFIGPFLSLFTSVLPPGEKLHRFVDILLTNGETTLFAAWLSFFKMNEPYFLQQTDASQLMDALNYSLERMQTAESSVMDTLQRSMLQWCITLEPSMIADFRKNAPMQWFNMDLVLKMARETDRELLLAHASKSTGNSSSSSTTLSPRFSRSKLTSNPVVRLEGSDKAPASINLHILWIISNLRNPFSSFEADEYRQAAVNTCKEILQLNGYADILLQQHSDLGKSPGHPTSASPLLPGSTRSSVSDEFELFNDASSTTELWRAPDSHSSLISLLEGLMQSAKELMVDVSDESRVHLLLDHLYLCLQASRDAIPLYKYTKMLTSDLMRRLIGGDGRGSKGKPWRKKLRNVFRPRRGGASKHSNFSPTSFAEDSAQSSVEGVKSFHADHNQNHQQQTKKFPVRRSKSNSDLAKVQEIAQEVTKKLRKKPVVNKLMDESPWKIQMGILLLTLKTDAENNTIRLYDGLSDEVISSKLSGLYNFIASSIQASMEKAIANARFSTKGGSHRGVNSNDTDTEDDDDDSFMSFVNYQLRIWNLDANSSLFCGIWSRAREADLRRQKSITGSLGPTHQRFSTLTGKRYSKEEADGETASKLDLQSLKNRPKKNRIPRRQDKMRSRSSPFGQGKEQVAVRMLNRFESMEESSMKILDISKGREHASETSQHWRALYWALRSNYHLSLEMSRLAATEPHLPCVPFIEQLVETLHSITYAMQAKLCDAARVDHIMSELESFQSIVKKENNTSADSRAVEVLLDDLGDQIKLCKSKLWRDYLTEHLEGLRGHIIL